MIDGLKDICKKTEHVSREAYDAVLKHWDHIAKPLDGLGLFEKLTARIGAIQGRESLSVKNRTLLLFLSDNGIVEEGVSQSGMEVTNKVGQAMAKGESTVCKMAQKADVRVHPVDIGMWGEHISGIEDKRIRNASRNFLKEPAMTPEETKKAIRTGYEEAIKLNNKGTDILLLGEMGIGNTTTSTALSCALLGKDPGEMTGKGAGLTDKQNEHKIKVIEEALKKYDISQDDVMGLLSTFGGYDIAGMVGAIFAGAKSRMPIIADGLITLTAVLIACRIDPNIKNYCIPSHIPREPMGRYILKELGYDAPIKADMALGEGTGAVLLMPLLDVCINLYDNGLRFYGLNIDEYERYDS